MKFRAVASIALAAAVAAGLAGCNLISPLSTTIQYDASDGVGLTVGSIDLRNVLILVDGESENPTSGALVAAIVNQSGADGTVTITGEGGVSATVPVTADPNFTKVGYGDGPTVTLDGLNLPPGGTVELTFTSPDGSTGSVEVPVLDGILAEYSTLAPTAPAATAPATPAATPGATEAPAEGETPAQP